ncbi:hypothetical protein BT93_A2121 [Corymbia citriodora subsp. variegata]|nr:hypothetical protein BT93_A2121 [Corymbia citriodora subsp. variegata]
MLHFWCFCIANGLILCSRCLGKSWAICHLLSSSQPSCIPFFTFIITWLSCPVSYFLGILCTDYRFST